ncbi:hypothetical protein N9B54_04210, partial [Mariniblastus sp.]|nr:hypothetical protein [Mariniblastus sp.]
MYQARFRLGNSVALQVPDFDRAISTPTDNAVAVRTERDAQYFICMALKGKLFLARIGIPDFYGFIPASTDNAVSVRAKSDATYYACMPLKGNEWPSRFGTNDPDYAVLIRTSTDNAV